MDKLDSKLREIREFCENNTDPEIIKKYARYFKEGYDAYGVGTEVFESRRDLWLREWADELSFDDYLELGRRLVLTGKFEEASFAVNFMHHQTDEFTPDTFEKLGAWLENGIQNWAHTDVLCGYSLAHFFKSGMLEIEALKPWVKSASLWKRRAVPVTMVELVKKGAEFERVFAIIEPLMMDKEKKVQQGLGWLLREMWKKDAGVTEEFLFKWKESCGRTIIQYATEKMSKEYRLKFRRSKK